MPAIIGLTWKSKMPSRQKPVEPRRRDKREDVLDLWAMGRMTSFEIAASLSLSRGRVTAYVSEAREVGDPRAKRRVQAERKTPREWDEESVQLLLRLFDEGLSSLELAPRLNRSPTAVIAKLHRLGYFLRERDRNRHS